MTLCFRQFSSPMFLHKIVPQTSVADDRGLLRLNEYDLSVQVLLLQVFSKQTLREFP